MCNMSGKEIGFSFDDVNSDDVIFEGCDETFFEEMVSNILKGIRGQKWFSEGNKTEGTLTFYSEFGIMVKWTTTMMGSDWDDDEEENHLQEIILVPSSDYKVVEL